jgi:flavin-dependent dehydrogenase
LTHAAPYDVVIAGASFAGIALAQSVRGRVLLIDRDEIGAGQTSACGAPHRLVRAMGADEAVQQVHDRIHIATRTGRHVWDLRREPFCTFDYRRFCELAVARSGADVLRASAHGVEDLTVHTTAGSYRGRFVADCTGWRAALASALAPARPGEQWRAFGIESEVACDFPSGLHFYFWRDVAPDGYAWAFPCGGRVRFGVLSYGGATQLRSGLHALMARFGTAPERYHGGFLAAGTVDPVVGKLFVVGDSAGHCLPLTGEGIRTAVHAAWRAGGLMSEVIAGGATPEWARSEYRAFVGAQRRGIRFLASATWAAMRLPDRALDAAILAFSSTRAQRAFLSRYLGLFGSGGAPVP